MDPFSATTYHTSDNISTTTDEEEVEAEAEKETGIDAVVPNHDQDQEVEKEVETEQGKDGGHGQGPVTEGMIKVEESTVGMEDVTINDTGLLTTWTWK